MDKAKLDELIGAPNAGAVFDQLGGYTETFDSTSGSDTLTVTVYTHGSAAMARRFVRGFAKADPTTTAIALPGVPDGVVVIAREPASDGAYHDAAVAPYGRRSVDVELKTASAGPVPMLATVAQDQYHRLSHATGAT
jgi:hypothetical protein